MKAAVIGSRTFDDYELLCNTLSQFKIEVIISGGAKGADTLARQYAEIHHIPLEEIKPDYEKFHPRRAPLERNKTIVERADQVIAFWDRRSRGTRQALSYAEKLRKPIHIIEFTFYANRAPRHLGL